MVQRIAGAPAQHISSLQAAALVKSGDWVDYGTSLCQPDVFDRALAARAAELANVKIRSCLSMKPRAVLDADPEGAHIHWFSWHFSGYDRKKHDAGRCNYLPLNLGEVPDYYRRFLAPVDVVIFKCCPMDDNGFFNFSAANLWHRAVLERARIVIVEVTQNNPYVFGTENGVHVSEVDYILEGDASNFVVWVYESCLTLTEGEGLHPRSPTSGTSRSHRPRASAGLRPQTHLAGS